MSLERYIEIFFSFFFKKKPKSPFSFSTYFWSGWFGFSDFFLSFYLFINLLRAQFIIAFFLLVPFHLFLFFCFAVFRIFFFLYTLTKNSFTLTHTQTQTHTYSNARIEETVNTENKIYCFSEILWSSTEPIKFMYKFTINSQNVLRGNIYTHQSYMKHMAHKQIQYRLNDNSSTTNNNKH